MKKTFIALVFFANMLLAQIGVIDDFNIEPTEPDYWLKVTSENTNLSVAYLNIAYVTSPVVEGKALKMQYNIHDSDVWGGFFQAQHWHPDTNAYFDFSDFENLSIWYYNAVPQSDPGRVEFRLELFDASDSPNGPNTYDANQTEFYYSFHQILDDSPGWHQITLPLEKTDTYDNQGFTLTGWAGILGNETLDLDKIKGFGFEFSVIPGDEEFVSGEIVFDQFLTEGAREKPLIIFNGNSVSQNFSQFTWGQSTLNLLPGGGQTTSSNALLWVQGDEWGNGYTGAGWNIDPSENIRFRWDIDTLKFTMKASALTSDIRLQFESGPDGKKSLDFTPISDNDWHYYSFPLADFIDADGTTNFDPSAISVFQFFAPGNSVSGNEILFDYIWTGNPIIDIEAPEAPGLIAVITGNYYNLITWADVPGEQGETYNVYYSNQPIISINDPGVEVVSLNIGENIQIVEHDLRAPKFDQSVSYYYAVDCTDSFGNISEPGVTISPTTNQAKGVAVIEPVSLPSFVADGDLSEWNGIMPFRMYPSDGSGTIVPNTIIDGDNDLSADIRLAIDNEYIYFAFDIQDDIISNDTNFASYFIDAPDLYIGLYDWHGAPHFGYQRGVEPDYHFRFGVNGVILDNVAGTIIKYNTGDNEYYWGEKFPTGYIVEGKLSLDLIAQVGNDERFFPSVGMRIPIDISINDNDTPSSDLREGILTYSRNNMDMSWNDVSRWTHTWIGEQWSVGDPYSGVINVTDGWNIVSIPAVLTDMMVNSVFPDAVSSAFEFNTSYQSVDQFENGKGYWLKFENQGAYPVSGFENLSNEIPVVSGWNLVGGYDYDIPVSNISSEPAGIMISNFFDFNGGYTQANVLVPGKGYWIRCSSVGTLLINNSSTQKKRIETIGENWVSLSFFDKKGNHSIMYLSEENIKTEEYLLPPLPPAGVFDIRFADNSYVESKNGQNNIKLNSVEYPLTITASGSNIMLKDDMGGQFINATLADGESIVLGESNINTLVVQLNEIPVSFSLSQNYPNPFNPVTKIKFGLPEETRTILEVYNVLGERVALLIDQTLEAGYHEYDFSGINLSSGVYFYHINAGNFSDTKKMMLLK